MAERLTTIVVGDATPFSRQAGGRLVVVQGPDLGKAVELGETPVGIGWGEECGFVLTDRAVSSQHLLAERRGQTLILRDQNSKNGSYLEGTRFQEIVVGFGAEVQIGRTILKYLPQELPIEPDAHDKTAFGALVGKSLHMRRLFRLLGEVAPHDTTVLIEGETGTGKEVVAEEIHRRSPRSEEPFVVFDCGSVARELVASALFGHAKGAFTGATTDRRGAFAEADGGTIFLDEVGELPLDLQPSLLRAIEKKAICPVGTTRYQGVDVRVLAATNRDLRAEVLARRFREDLYYRLAVIRLALPPLRERGEDARVLAEHFLRIFARGRPLRLVEEDVERLLSHSWPGNVRELKNVIERACVFSQGDRIAITEALAGQDGTLRAPDARTDLPFREAKDEAVASFERSYVAALLQECHGNVSLVAKRAELDRKHVYNLLEKHGLKADRSHEES